MKSKKTESAIIVESSISSEQKNITGITLIVLVVTIVVLLVLAGVVINLSLGENGIIGKAKSAVDKYEQSAENEKMELAKISSLINNRDVNISDELINAIVAKLEQKNVIKAVPAGTVISYIGSSLPEGYLACDGTKYSVSEYPNLYNKLKDLDHTGWAVADWITEFTVPDLRGEFLRGTGTNSHERGGKGDEIGKHQAPTVFPWTYTFNAGNSMILVSVAENNTNNNYIDYDTVRRIDSSYYRDIATGNISTRTNNIDLTSRPTNTSVLYCIKY